MNHRWQTLETIEVPGASGESLVVVRQRDLRLLLDRLEELEDVATVRSIRKADEEFVPDSVVKALLDGNHPVKVWREHRGLTATALAERVGISQGHVSALENDKRDPSLSTLKKLAEVLEVDVEDLIP